MTSRLETLPRNGGMTGQWCPQYFSLQSALPARHEYPCRDIVVRMLGAQFQQPVDRIAESGKLASQPLPRTSDRWCPVAFLASRYSVSAATSSERRLWSPAIHEGDDHKPGGPATTAHSWKLGRIQPRFASQDLAGTDGESDRRGHGRLLRAAGQACKQLAQETPHGCGNASRRRGIPTAQATRYLDP